MTKKIYLIRHGQTIWSLAQKHTGLTDLPLTEEGRKEALELKLKLEKISFQKIFCSPLKRARETCFLTGYQDKAVIDPDLVEWNYGEYEGKTTQEIHQKDPSWTIFRKGAPHGESLADIEKRAQRMLDKLEPFSGDIALFSSGHILRSLAAKWLGFSISAGESLALSTASLSILGYEHTTRVLLLWNAT